MVREKARAAGLGQQIIGAIATKTACFLGGSRLSQFSYVRTVVT
jgi:hypothetical protein